MFVSDTTPRVLIHITLVVEPVHIFQARNRVSKSLNLIYWLSSVSIYIPTHQFLHATTSCHVYQSKNPYRTIRLCVLTWFNELFDTGCNDLLVWLKNSGYNEKLVRQQILKARKYRRTEFLHSQRGKFIKISWCLILPIILFFWSLRIFCH